MTNICQCCLIDKDGELPDSRLFDTGECAECGKFGDVADPELLGIYRGLDIPPVDVWAYLPRVKQHRLTFSSFDRPEVPLSGEDVGRALKNYFSRPKRKKMKNSENHG